MTTKYKWVEGEYVDWLDEACIKRGNIVGGDEFKYPSAYGTLLGRIGLLLWDLKLSEEQQEILKNEIKKLKMEVEK